MKRIRRFHKQLSLMIDSCDAEDGVSYHFYKLFFIGEFKNGKG
jgi:hypothetical protein